MKKDIPTLEVRAENDSTPVRFTRKQYEYLDKVFSENPGSPTTTDEQLRWYSGVRTVVHHVKTLVQV